MADASTEPKLAQTETELATKPLQGDEKAAEAPKETSDAPAAVRKPVSIFLLRARDR
jgi:Ran-binding protein 1